MLGEDLVALRYLLVDTLQPQVMVVQLIEAVLQGIAVLGDQFQLLLQLTNLLLEGFMLAVELVFFLRVESDLYPLQEATKWEFCGDDKMQEKREGS